MYTHLEDYIRSLLINIGIHDPPDLNISNVTNRLKLEVVYRENSFRFGNEIVIGPGTRQQQWQTFGHELCHYLRHYGNQLLMHPLFVNLQEYQANYFAYHFCVPTFMLERLEEVSVDAIMNLFNVEYDFAVKRLEMYQSKVFERKMISARAYS